MKPRLLLAAVLLASAAGLPAMAQPISDDIPTLATVQVRPDAEQQLELLARKVMDLAAVEVRPDALTLLQAAGLVPVNLERWIDLPTLPSLPSRAMIRLPYEVLPYALQR